MKETLILTVFTVVIAGVIFVSLERFNKECRSLGGVPVMQQYGKICLSAGTVIDIGAKE